MGKGCLQNTKYFFIYLKNFNISFLNIQTTGPLVQLSPMESFVPNLLLFSHTPISLAIQQVCAVHKIGSARVGLNRC